MKCKIQNCENKILSKKLYNKEYRVKNKSKIRETRKKHRLKNKKRLNFLCKEWKSKNKEKIGKSRYISDKKYRKKYPLKKIARKKAERIKITPFDVCLICGSKENLERHHPDYNYPLWILRLCREHHTTYGPKLTIKSKQDRK